MIYLGISSTTGKLKSTSYCNIVVNTLVVGTLMKNIVQNVLALLRAYSCKWLLWPLLAFLKQAKCSQ